MGHTSIGCQQQWGFGLERELRGETAAKGYFLGSRSECPECHRCDGVPPGATEISIGAAEMSKRSSISVGVVILLALLVSVPAAVKAQIGGGSIVGNVKDPSGAAVVGAAVQATNLETNEVRKTATNEAGYYEFPLLPAGRYRLEAQMEGFQRATTAEFALNAGTRPRFDLALVLGKLAESVEVVAAAPLVNTTTTDLGVVIDQNKVESLPLNGRNWQQLVGLQAGVLASPPTAVGDRGGIEFNGSSGFGTNLLLDGVDMTFGEYPASASDAAAGGGGARINTVSVEAIEEFKTTASAFSAEYGRATGGVLNITTKSGSNAFHGALFEFLRNDILDANSFYSNRSGFAKPPLRWNQYGGNLAGPVLKNRAFFFFNYEGAKTRRNQQITGNVATPALKAQVTPVIRETMNRLPGTFAPTSNLNIGLHRRNDRSKTDEHTTLSRGDVKLGMHRLTMRFSYNHQDFSDPILLESSPQLFPTRFHNAVAQDGWTISPSVFNELRVGFNRMDLDRDYVGLRNVPAWFTVAGVGLGVSLQAHIHYTNNTYTLADNFTMVRGRHTLKAGFEIREVRSRRFQDNVPLMYYNNLNDFIADRANRVRVVFGGTKALRNRNYGIFAQDDFRISPRVQLNAGVRYEYYPPLKGGYNISTSDPLGPFGKAGEPMSRPDKNNFGPRIGLVYDVLGNQRLVVRAGGGIANTPPTFARYFDFAFMDPRIPFNPIIAVSDLPPGINSRYPFDVSFIPSVIANPSLLPANLILSRSVLDYNQRDEYAGQWNLSIQHAAAKNLAVQASYVGSRGLKTSGVRWLNLPDPVTGRRPSPQLGDIYFRENAGNSSYHALQLSANQRLNRGMTFDIYYTFAKTLTYYGADSTLTRTNSAIQDPNNIAASYGPKDSDIRHIWTAVYSYRLPGPGFASGSRPGRAVLHGWNLQGITGGRSGRPVNVVAGTDLIGNAYVDGQRPDILGGVNRYVRDTNALVWLNSAAFSTAIPKRERRYGNLGYNALRGPSAFTFDAALHKSFPIREGHRLTFRFEMFNALNHKVLNDPNANASNPNFGQILGASMGRCIQLALKYVF
ncbi:MAG: TonB-dependent receptor [Acidobacteria bacterium]|nr:TonB-dependent receptor [Acidobacteriota bacterium]